MAALTLAIARDNEPDWSIPGNCCAAVAEAINEKASGTVSRSGRSKYFGIPKCTSSSSTQRSMRSRGSCETPHIEANVKSATKSATDIPKWSAISCVETVCRSMSHGNITSKRRRRILTGRGPRRITTDLHESVRSTTQRHVGAIAPVQELRLGQEIRGANVQMPGHSRTE